MNWLDAVLEDIRAGAPMRQSVLASGHSMAEWRELMLVPGNKTRALQARAAAEVHAAKVIYARGASDPRNLHWWLTRSFPSRWSDKATLEKLLADQNSGKPTESMSGSSSEELLEQAGNGSL